MSGVVNIGISCIAAEFKPLNLPCGSNFTLSVRDELFDMEAASRLFEEDKDIVNEVQNQFRNGNDIVLLSKLYPLTEDDGYDPCCKNDFEQSIPEILETCSSLDHVSLISFFDHQWLHGKKKKKIRKFKL